ncbi:uncharacterized protein N7529_012157 [Penicillium soppii]|uniref:uncharacterized protein n=1 Tax=Penicillium soppii TaxID=69789 RepID=UPI002547454C|nr:uncharacterized protein N7529_012157 [Penicillium soppii]KAJ5852772.1 hypothetical protein N7529_012157 [Penicillium soppii]
MLSSLKAGRQKLNEYYSQTDKVRGHIYIIATILAPDNSKDLINVITDDDVDDDIDDDVDNDVDSNHVSANTHAVELPLPELGPRIRTSGRKRKITLDDEFETY